MQQVQGEGEGSVELHFVDEGALTNHRYRITLDTSGEAKTYSVTDLDEGTQVLTGIPLSDGIQESPVFDGIALVVTDLEESRADADATGWVVGDTDLAVAVSGGTTRISILTIQLLATETDYEIEIVDDVVGQSIRLYNIPVTDLRFTVTGGDGQPRDVVFVDGNDDGLPGDGDKLYLVEPNGDGDPALAWALEFDATTGTVLPDTVEWVKFSNLDWAKDGSGFYYSRFPATGEGETFQALNKNHQVYFHRLGTDQNEDTLVYATESEPDLNHIAQVSNDGRWLVVTSSSGTDDRYRVTLIDLEDDSAQPRVIVPGFDNNYSYVGNIGDEFFFVTNDGAPLKKVVMTDISSAEPEWTTVIPESEQTLDGVSLVGGKLIASYLVDAKSKIEVFGLDGTPQGEVALPGIGSAGGFGGEPEETETFYSFSSYNRPSTIYRYDVSTGESTVWEQPEVSFNPDDFVVEQKFYTSKDGTRVPMFLVRSKAVAESGKAVPTLLYGYGGFNISLTPGFSPSRLAWIESGGAYAVANIRGGGEYGKEWHDAGRLNNKQNVFDDFIAAGEYLIDQGITPKGGLAIQGGSNGGLLIGAVTNQRPDLFAAGNAAVGVMDMLRFDQFTAGRYWVDDYGYPSKEADWKVLRAYSPYHNIRSGVDYPALLVTTADTDDRVVPGHSFKYTAALQAADLGDKPQLIRIETRAGHGSGKPTDKVIDEYGDILAFLAYHTGLEVPPAN